MDYQAYPFQPYLENTHYYFQSEGKRGKITKIVAFSFITENVVNLALLDFDPVTQISTDQTVSNNGDMPEVLATVHAIILDYLGKFPDRAIYISGNSSSRTRLYRIAIGRYYGMLSLQLSILGFHDNDWHPFEPNREFESFLIVRNSLH